MRQLRFTVQATLGGRVVAHATGDTLAQALHEFRTELADNEIDWQQLSNQARRAQDDAVA